MRESKKGNLSYEWKDFSFIGIINNTVHMTKDIFEESYGTFQAMIYPQNANKPYAIWSENFIVLFLNEDPYGIASVPRNPSNYMFG